MSDGREMGLSPSDCMVSGPSGGSGADLTEFEPGLTGTELALSLVRHLPDFDQERRLQLLGVLRGISSFVLDEPRIIRPLTEHCLRLEAQIRERNAEGIYPDEEREQDESEFEQTANLMGNIGNESVVITLARLSSSVVPEVRDCAMVNLIEAVTIMGWARRHEATRNFQEPNQKIKIQTHIRAAQVISGYIEQRLLGGGRSWDSLLHLTEAINALGAIGVPQGIEVLGQVLVSDAVAPTFKETAVEALGQIGTGEVLPLLFAALENDEGLVGVKAARVLRGIDFPETRSWLRQRMNAGEYDSARAAESLARMGEVEIAPLVCKMLSESQNDGDQRDLISALGFLAYSEGVELILPFLDHEWASLREVSVVALGRIGGLKSVEVIRAKLSDDDEKVSSVALRVLARMKDPAAVPGLREQAVGSLNYFRRRDAIQTLGEIGDAMEVPLLVQALEDGEIEVRLVAVEALGKIGGLEAAAALELASRENSSYKVRMAAEKVLQGGGDE